MNSTAKTTDEYLASLPAWQAQKLAQFRTLVQAASGDITEQIKWGVPTFILNGKIVFAMSGFKHHVKYNFIKNGALLNDPQGLFNNGLESAKSRGIDQTEQQTVDETALKDLIQQAIQALAQ